MVVFLLSDFPGLILWCMSYLLCVASDVCTHWVYVLLILFFFLIYFYFLSLFMLTEREHKQGRGRERIPSRFHAISAEPDMGSIPETVRS